MPDLYDRATEREEMDRELAVKERRPEGPKATGHCLNCHEPTLPPDVLAKVKKGATKLPADTPRWCDREYLTDWEKRQK